MKDNIQLLDNLARLVSLTCAFAIPAFLIWRAARKSYRKILTEHPALSPGAGEFMVAYAGAEHFKNPGMSMAYEAVGRLQLGKDAVVFCGRWIDGQALEMRFLPGKTSVAWVGRRFRNGIAAWFVLEQDGQRHYFTSDAVLRGPMALGSFYRSSRILFQEAEKVLLPL